MKYFFQVLDVLFYDVVKSLTLKHAKSRNDLITFNLNYTFSDFPHFSRLILWTRQENVYFKECEGLLHYNTGEWKLSRSLDLFIVFTCCSNIALSKINKASRKTNWSIHKKMKSFPLSVSTHAHDISGFLSYLVLRNYELRGNWKPIAYCKNIIKR